MLFNRKRQTVMALVVFSGIWGGTVSVAHAGPYRSHRPQHHSYRGYKDRVSFPELLAKTFVYAGMEYYYHQGYFYRRGVDRYVIVNAPVGAVIPEVPYGYEIIVVNGRRYLHYNHTYYLKEPRGYVVVADPLYDGVTLPLDTPALERFHPVPPDASPGQYTVNIPDAQGGYIPVTLARKGGGFIGPQGEYYPEFPSVEQLKVMYGTAKD